MNGEKLKVLVTGGSGGVGSYLIPALLKAGHSVINLDCRRQNDDRAEFVFGDVRNRQFVQQVMAGCQVVCHLAEFTTASARVAANEIYWGNAQAASSVIQSAADLKLRRVIYASSCQVYGCWGEGLVPPERLPIDENYPLRPRNVYGLSKVCNEEFAKLTHLETKMPITIFRFPWVITLMEPRKRWAERVQQDDGPLDELATYVHGSDLAAAFVAAIEKDIPGCEVYNIVASEAMSGKPMRERLARHHPNFPPLPPEWPDFKSLALADKARRDLAWQPKWNFRDFLLQK